MNKKLISAAVMLGVSGAATAVNVNPDGLGQVLLYPYYTGNDGKSTTVHVVNTTGQTKAVKVRFSEAGNSWEILDFNLYLSPYDVWTAALSLDADGNPLLQTRDTSCTVPQFNVTDASINLSQVGIAEQPNFYANITTFGHGNTEVNEAPFYVDGDVANGFISPKVRAAEGHVEMIEMGVVTGTPADNILHRDGVPKDCASLSTSWASTGNATDWGRNRDSDILPPSGGLFGIANIIDVPNGIDRGYDAVAIDNFWDATLVTGTNSAHVKPGSSYPNLNGTVITNTGAYRDLGSKDSNVVVPTVTGGTAVVTDTWTETADALSAVLTVANIYNEFTSYSGTASATDWVVTFPTKHFYANPSTYVYSGGIARGQEGGLTTFFGDQGDFCNPVGITVYDQEERTAGGTVGFSPYLPQTDGLCYEANVIEFGDRGVLASGLSKVLANTYDAGWANLSFAGYMAQGPSSNLYYHGLPAIGIATFDAKNDTAGRLRNYASAFAHKYNRQVVTSSSLP